jgi:hypothetical protein
MEECYSVCQLFSIKVNALPMCVGLISLTTSSANENAQRSSKKTIQPKDVLDALTDLEFGSFVPRLEAELASKYHPVS